MSCENIKGIRNLFLSFTPCLVEGNAIVHRKHSMADDNEMPSFNACGYRNTILPGNITKIASARPTMSFSIVPQKDVPASYYTGCAEIDVDIEYFDGRIISGQGGVVISTSGMTDERVSLDLSFETITEVKGN